MFAPKFRGARLAFVVINLAGCAQQTEYRRPPSPVAQQWAKVAESHDAAALQQVHWRNYFRDPRLQALIALALENNRDLRAAMARIDEARAQLGIAQADRVPTVNGNVQGSLMSTPSSLNTGVSSRRIDVQSSLSAFELDLWGRVAALNDAARASFLATREASRMVQLSLIAEIANHYFILLQLTEQRKLLRAIVATHERSLTVMQAGRDLGGAQDFDVQQTAGLLAASQGTLAALEQQQRTTEHQLTYLIGASTEGLPPGLPLEEQGLDQSLRAGLPSAVLQLRPDVMAAEQRLMAAHANIDAARAAFYPRISLTSVLGFAGSGLMNLFAGGAWMFQPAVTAPLFDGGRTAAALDLSEARKTIAVAEYEKTLQLAFKEVADQLSARQSLRTQVASARTVEAAQASRQRIAHARYDAGMTGYLDVLEADRAMLSARQASAQVLRDQLAAAAMLYKSLGGGAEPSTPAQMPDYPAIPLLADRQARAGTTSASP